LFAWGNKTLLVGQGADIRRVRGLWVSGDFFQALGIVPERGRLLTADDDRRGCGAGPARSEEQTSALQSHRDLHSFPTRRSSDLLWVSGDFFQALGIVPERGRLLTADDDRRGCGAGPA